MTILNRTRFAFDEPPAGLSNRVKKFLTGKISDADLAQVMNLFNDTSEDEAPNIREAEAEPVPANPSTHATNNKTRNSLGIDQSLSPGAAKILADAKAKAARKFGRIAEDQASNFQRRWGNTAGRIGTNYSKSWVNE